MNDVDGRGVRASVVAIASTLLTSVGIQALNVLTGVALARSLGVDGRGELAVLLLWPMLIASIATIGVPDAAAYAAARRAAAPELVLGTVVALGVVQSCVGVLVSGLVLFAVADQSPTSAIVVSSLLVPPYILSGHIAAILQGHESLNAFNVTRLAVPVSSAAALVGLAMFGVLGVTAATVVYATTYTLVAMLAGALAVRDGGGRRPRFDAGTARALVRYGTRSHVGFVATTLNERLDQLVISVVLSATALGLYVVAVTVTAGVAVVGSTVALVALPRVARCAGDLAAARPLCRQLLAGGSAIVLAIAGTLFVVAPWLLSLLFGNAFVDAKAACRILLVAAVFLAISRLLSTMLKGLGRPLLAGLGDVLGLGVTIATLPVLLPIAGIEGAAIASLLAYATACGVMAIRLARALRCPMRELVFRPRSATPAPAGGNST